jgi:hypothetical protein
MRGPVQEVVLGTLLVTAGGALVVLLPVDVPLLVPPLPGDPPATAL